MAAMFDIFKKLGSRPSTPVQPTASPSPALKSSTKVKTMAKSWSSSRPTTPMITVPKGKRITPPSTPCTPRLQARELPTPMYIPSTPASAPTPAPSMQRRGQRRSSDADRNASDGEATILKPRPLRVMRRPAILGGPTVPVDQLPPPAPAAPTARTPAPPPPQNQHHRSRVSSSPGPPPPLHAQPPQMSQYQRDLYARPSPPMAYPAAYAPPPEPFTRTRSTEPAPPLARRESRERERSHEHRRGASISTTEGLIPPRVNLHCSLLPLSSSWALGVKSFVFFNIAHKTHEIRLCTPPSNPRPYDPLQKRPLNQAERDKWAVDSTVTRMKLVVRDFPWWPVYILRPQGIRCIDVWEEVYQSFYEVISAHDWNNRVVTKALVDACRPAFERRCAESERWALPDYEARQGMRRVDMLKGRTIFAGLRMMHAKSGQRVVPGRCELELVLEYPNPQMPV